MTQPSVAIYNPFSTGGGGVSFERAVAAYYMVQLLGQEIPRGLTTGIAVSIRLQARQQGAPLDDILVIAQEGTTRYQLQIQAKHSLTFTENNKTFKEVIAASWAAFNGSHGFAFNKQNDRLGIAVASLSADVMSHFLPLLEVARTSSSGTDFWQKAGSIVAQEKFAVLIRNLVNNVHPAPVSDDDVWMFMKCLVVLKFELEQEGSTDLNYAWNSLLGQTPGREPSIALSIFDTILAEADHLAPLAGTVDKDRLQLTIRARHPKLWPAFSPDDALAEDLQQVGLVFVPPTEYGRAEQILDRDNFVILAGPPHSGKTATAHHLALHKKLADNSRSIVRFRGGDAWETAFLAPNSIVILDDYYGETTLENRTRAGRFVDLERLARNNTVVVTTRISVLEQAKQETRLSDEATLDDHVIRLTQEGSYDDAALTEILRRHLDYMQSEGVVLSARLTPEKATVAWDGRHDIVRQLRFPHNIERLCRQHLRAVNVEFHVIMNSRVA